MTSIVTSSSAGADLGLLAKDIAELALALVTYSSRVRVSASSDRKFSSGRNGGPDEIDIIDIPHWEPRIMVVGMVIRSVGNTACFSRWGDSEGKHFRCRCFCDSSMAA